LGESGKNANWRELAGGGSLSCGRLEAGESSKAVERTEGEGILGRLGRNFNIGVWC